jgi:uncharacterized Zn-binding protein involved in type VI secretion
MMHPMRRVVLLCAAALGAVSLAACGGDSPSHPRPPVRLAIAAPADGGVTRARSVELRGTVSPGSATVTVGGRRAAISGGSFRATVQLAAGTNVVDVLASAGSARPAMTAIRVRRVVPVAVPDLSGLSVTDARRRLGDLRLGTKVDEQGGIFDSLFPGDPHVCSTDPAAGEDVDPGQTVTLLVARRC